MCGKQESFVAWICSTVLQPATHQLVVHPQRRILDLPSSATTVFYDIASTMMGAMKMTCFGHPIFNGIHLTFVLVRDDCNVSYVH